MELGISVVICCYNSGWIIKRTLEGLKKQKVPSTFRWEIILVDNNCSDDTVALAQNAMSDSNIEFIIVTEPNPGLSHARRKGIETIKYDIVLYCDDDNILCEDYVSTMYNIMRSDKHIGAAGGKGVAEFLAVPESDVLAHLNYYAVGSQMDGRTDWLYGAGVSLRTWLVREVYYNQKCYLTGRKGNLLLSGDDSELVMSIVNRGFAIYPTDDVYYVHVLKADRLTNNYYKRLYKGLLMPIPVFDSMRAAINRNGFRVILGKYRRLLQNYIMFSIFRWRLDAKKERERNKLELERYNYWGIINLYMIYREWKNIHNKWIP